MKHRAKLKRCSIDGCTNQAKRRGVCCRHGAYRNPNDESTAFKSCFGSEVENTTASLPNRGNSAASMNQDSLPDEVVVCGVVAEHCEGV